MNMNFSTNLKKIRKSLDLTQGKLADIIRVSQRTISHYENGDSEPELIIICRLADAFNISIEQLLGYDSLDDEDRYTDLKTLTHDYYLRKKRAESVLKNNYPL